MLPNHFFRSKILTDRRFIAVFILYLILCLTMGGFHAGNCNDDQCSQAQQLVPDNTDDVQLGILDDDLLHNSETCKICQWLKDSSSLAQFVFLVAHLDFIHKSSTNFPLPVLPCFLVHKFTIRPPPQIS